MEELSTKKTAKVSNNKANTESNEASSSVWKPLDRLPIQKTYKLYIGGKYPRTESGRYYQITENGKLMANVCRSSRKDFRNAVKIARESFSSDWSKRPAFVRGHIMYRIAEMLEARKAQFIEELVDLGDSKNSAEKEVLKSIDRLIYYAGWSDKYTQVFSSVNPTNTPHFNFSVYEPTGVVAAIAPEKFGLLGLISTIIPIILGGNVCIVLPSQQYGSLAISFSEVLHTSDLPGGVINILTGFEEELAPHFAKHMDVNALVYAADNINTIKQMQTDASLNVKRFFKWNFEDIFGEEAQSPYLILDTQEVKTTWHPIGY